MKVSDYIISFLANLGIRHSFVVQGGAVAHLIDSIAKSDDMEYICVGHEQAGAIAAHGYAARNNGFGCAMATTGPGIMNLINGVACLHYDSLPSIFIGGQVTTERYRAAQIGVRQLGFQESPHAELLRPVTKYSVTVTEKEDIRYELEKAVYLAKEGRPGPVFIDICDDVQRQEVEPEKLKSFSPPAAATNKAIDQDVARLTELFAASERPVMILGGGVRSGGHGRRAVELAESLGIPCLLTWGAYDCMPASHPLNAGGFGLHSGRAGNFTAQNSDLVIGIGARFTQHQTGTPAKTFARGARKVVVDVDRKELDKFPVIGMHVDVPICADIGAFLDAVDRQRNSIPKNDFAPWRKRIADWRAKYTAGTDAPPVKEGFSPYAIMAALSRAASEGDIVLGDVGATLSWMFQGWQVKKGQTLLTSFNNHTMGYALPAGIGAALANPGHNVWSLNGDGGVMMNIQELGVAAYHDLPVKVIIVNNHGYGVIQQTQDDYFGSRYNGTTPGSGLMNPNFIQLAESFGIPAIQVNGADDVDKALADAASRKGPVLVNIEIDPAARIVPAVTGGRPIEDTSPLLDRDEFKANMIVEPLS